MVSLYVSVGFIKKGIAQQVGKREVYTVTKESKTNNKTSFPDRSTSPPKSSFLEFKVDDELETLNTSSISTPKRLTINSAKGTEVLSEDEGIADTKKGHYKHETQDGEEELEEEGEDHHHHDKTPPVRKFIVKKEKTVKPRIIVTKQGKVKQTTITLPRSGVHQFDDDYGDAVAPSSPPVASLAANEDEFDSASMVSSITADSQQPNNRIVVRSVAKNKLVLDLPDKRSETRKKHIVNLSRNITEREVKIEDFEFQEKVRKVLHVTADGKFDDTDDINDLDSQASTNTDITTYFDRNVKSIFVERQRSRKSKITKLQKSDESERDNIGEDSKQPEEEKEDLNAALNAYLANLSEEELKMIEMLDDDAKRKLVEQMKV